MATVFTLLRTKESEGKRVRVAHGVVTIEAEETSDRKARELDDFSKDCLGLGEDNTLAAAVSDRGTHGSAHVYTRIADTENDHELTWGPGTPGSSCVVFDCGDQRVEAQLTFTNKKLPRGATITSRRTIFGLFQAEGD